MEIIKKQPTRIFTKHCRIRFAERVLQVSKKIDLETYQKINYNSLNFEMKKRILGSVVIDDTELDSILLNYLKTTYSGQEYLFYLNNNVIFVAIKKEVPIFVTCYKKDGIVGGFHFSTLYNKYYYTGKLK